MAQRQKDEIRKRLLSAALEVFSEVGFAAATVAEVAARAQVSTGNVYRYFASKEVLLREALPATFVSELKAMTRARVDALGAVRDIARLPADAE
ncbi:MAG TPA: helix-turn-helix domain-containing protein, partial [Polyangiaceae bacterium]|nr:helix-turn-helix domain-containing protein [Polyangiaceae bacterium]